MIWDMSIPVGLDLAVLVVDTMMSQTLFGESMRLLPNQLLEP